MTDTFCTSTPNCTIFPATKNIISYVVYFFAKHEKTVENYFPFYLSKI
jgi:hypothetical protein